MNRKLRVGIPIGLVVLTMCGLCAALGYLYVDSCRGYRYSGLDFVKAFGCLPVAPIVDIIETPRPTLEKPYEADYDWGTIIGGTMTAEATD